MLHRLSSPIQLALATAVAVAGAAAFGSTIASAQGLASLSCGQLWYERNAIYARHGYCFRTPQALATFGRGCRPPYGRLPPRAAERVNRIVAWERRKGCSG
jgi:hypothetical protein